MLALATPGEAARSKYCSFSDDSGTQCMYAAYAECPLRRTRNGRRLHPQSPIGQAYQVLIGRSPPLFSEPDVTERHPGFGALHDPLNAAGGRGSPTAAR
jgi:hypothetical protein